MANECRVYQLPNGLYGYKCAGGHDYQFGNMDYLSHEDAAIAALYDPAHCTTVVDPYAGVALEVPGAINIGMEEVGKAIYGEKFVLNPDTTGITSSDSKLKIGLIIPFLIILGVMYAIYLTLKGR